MRKLEQYQPEKQKKGEQTGLISVIVTVYNIREYLPKAVDSILSSTYQNLEVLLIDDGSTDGSERICDEYAKKDGRVRVVHQKNGGAYSARNTGLLEAKGDYLTFVDGDDWIEPQMYETCLPVASRVRPGWESDPKTDEFIKRHPDLQDVGDDV